MTSGEEERDRARSLRHVPLSQPLFLLLVEGFVERFPPANRGFFWQTLARTSTSLFLSTFLSMVFLPEKPFNNFWMQATNATTVTHLLCC